MPLGETEGREKIEIRVREKIERCYVNYFGIRRRKEKRTNKKMGIGSR